MKKRTLAKTLAAAAAALLAILAQPATAAPALDVPPKPVVEERFSVSALTDLMRQYDAYADEYIAAARVAARTGNTEKLDALVAGKGAQLQEKRDALAARLHGEFERLDNHIAQQNDRMGAVAESARVIYEETAAAAAEQQQDAPAQNQAPGDLLALFNTAAAPAAASADSGSVKVFGTAEVNAFIREFDSFVDNFIAAVHSKTKTLDQAMAELEPQLKRLQGNGEKIKVTLPPEEQARLAAHMEKQSERLMGAFSSMLGGIPLGTNAAGADVPARPTKPVPPTFSDPEANAYVKAYNAYLDEAIVAMKAVQKGDYSALNKLSEKEKDMKNKGNNLRKKLSADESRQLAGYLMQTLAYMGAAAAEP